MDRRIRRALGPLSQETFLIRSLERASPDLGGQRDEDDQEVRIWSLRARHISVSLNLDTVLRRVTEAAKELYRADIARIAPGRPDAGGLVFHDWAGTAVALHLPVADDGGDRPSLG